MADYYAKQQLKNDIYSHMNAIVERITEYIDSNIVGNQQEMIVLVEQAIESSSKEAVEKILGEIK